MVAFNTFRPSRASQSSTEYAEANTERSPWSRNVGHGRSSILRRCAETPAVVHTWTKRNPFVRCMTARSIAPHKSPRRVNHPDLVFIGHTSERQRAATMPGFSTLIGGTKAPSRSRIRCATFSANVEPKDIGYYTEDPPATAR